MKKQHIGDVEFESFANSKRYKTSPSDSSLLGCLRALLIQKDTKPMPMMQSSSSRLRALLIQKDTKHFSPSSKQRIDTISRYTSDQIRRKEHIKGEYSRLFYISCPVIWKSLFRSVFVHTES